MRVFRPPSFSRRGHVTARGATPRSTGPTSTLICDTERTRHMKIPWKLLLVTFACSSLTTPLRAAEQPASKTEAPAPKVAEPAPKDNGPDVSITPIGTYVHVDGDREKFREDTWMDDAWTGGIEEFTLQQKLDKTTTLNLFGRGIFDQHDYK